MINKTVILFAIMIFISQNSEAEVFKFFGSRAAGMGGAHVAVAEGSLAQYWNPAGLGLKESKFDLRMPVGGSIEFTKNLLESVDDLSKLATDIDDIQNKSGSSSMDLDSYKNFANALNKISALNEPGMGVLAEGRAGLGVQFWKIALSANVYAEFSADPFVDLTNVSLLDTGSATGIDAALSGGNTSDPTDPSLIGARDDLAVVIDDLVTRLDLDLAGNNSTQAANAVINEAVANSIDATTITNTINDINADYGGVQASLPAAGGGSFDDNTTNLTLRGASITEIALGAGGYFPFQKRIPVLSNVVVGGNLKMLQGKVGYAQINALNENADFEKVLDDATNNTKDSTKVSLDLGILYDRKKDWKFRTGIVLRNLTGPSFEGPTDNATTTTVVEGDGESYDMNPQVRGGVAFWPFKRWVFAADIDLTENSTVLEDYKSRLASLGTEFKLINSKMIDLALRLGLYKNIAESESALAYTAGLGLTLAHVNLDISGAYSSKSVNIEGGDSIPASAGASLTLSVLF